MDITRLCLLCLFLSGCLPAGSPEDDDCDRNMTRATCNENQEEEDLVDGDFPGPLTLSSNNVALTGAITDANEAELIDMGRNPGDIGFTSYLTSPVFGNNCESGNAGYEQMSLDGNDYGEPLTSYSLLKNTYLDCVIINVRDTRLTTNGIAALETRITVFSSLVLKYSSDNWSMTMSSSVHGTQTVFRHGSLITVTDFNNTDHVSRTLDVTFSDTEDIGSGTFRVYTTAALVSDEDPSIYLSGAWSIVDASGQRIDFLVTGDNTVAVTARGVGKGDYPIDD